MVFHYPFRVVYQIAKEPESTPEHTEEPSGNSPLPQILISVSKRYFKKAVDRNLIKRRFREAYRKNKEILLEKPQPLRPANVAFVYIAKEIEPFEVIEKKLKIVLSKIG
ncbi:ribonuclease P protein component [Pseudarcicella hirudinis]|uniref:Ribonuclease P protein component n=2 Tax=Pseudarcicella hirudinis TaxID=1079859 RepID=A0A1I5QLW9_9BACT|nr:ribonuclease P protein component [Pseudarcicella hirudinis]